MASVTFRRFVVDSSGIVTERVYTTVYTPEGWTYAVLIFA